MGKVISFLGLKSFLAPVGAEDGDVYRLNWERMFLVLQSATFAHSLGPLSPRYFVSSQHET